MSVVAFLDDAYDEETFEQLKAVAMKSVARILKQYSLRDDPNVSAAAVCRRGRLRYDLQLPIRSVANLNVREPCAELLSHYLGDDYTGKPPRCLVAFAGAEAQEWHTDVDPLFGDEKDKDHEYPPFYLTLITALEDIRDESMGPTEFEDGRKALLKANQSVLFDGLTVHRGGSSFVDRPPVVYRVFHRRWYRDANEK